MVLDLEYKDISIKKRLSSANSNMIDILRIVATYLVLIGHGISAFEFPIAGQRGNVIQNSGVVWLFLLSGFLTAYSLENKAANEEFCYKSYVKKRFTRIY